MNFNTYGLLVGIGVVIVTITLDTHTNNKKLYLKISDYILLLTFTLIGARSLYILHNIPEILNGTVTWWNISDGGLTIYGALIGILLATFLISKLRKIPFFVLTDGIVKNLPLAQSLGRVGNYFNHELYGKPSTLPWSIQIPTERRLQGYEQYSTFHPVFLYESILNILNWFILNKILKQKNYKDGTITSIYLINYGIIRLLMNMIRIDKEYLMGIETSNIASVLVISLGILILILISPEKVKKTIAKTFSDIFNGYLTLIIPILVATIFSSGPLIYRIVTSIFISIVPISTFLILKLLGKVSDFDMTDRKGRPLYCTITTLAIALLYLVTLEQGDTALIIITLNTLIISTFFTIVTLFWKISGHMTYLTMTYTSLVFLLPYPFIILLFPLIPFVAWSRIELKKHTVLQVIAGTLTSFAISLLVFTLT